MQAWRPGTWRRYQASFKRFTSFCESFDLDPRRCSVSDYLAFSEYLVRTGISAQTISNHLSAVKTVCKVLNINSHLWDSDHWRWNHRSLHMSIRKLAKLQSVVTFQHFVAAMHTCDLLNWPAVKFSMILGFFGLLRISNYAIETGSQLDVSRNTLIKDCSLGKDSITLNIKWSKANQLDSDTVTLPATKEHLYCPVTNWVSYMASLSHSVLDLNWPIFIHQQKGQVFWPSTRDARELHRFVWESAGLAAAAYTPHSLRRGGATYFAENGIPLEDIQRLGLWRSDAIKYYLKRLNFSRIHLFEFLKHV